MTVQETTTPAVKIQVTSKICSCCGMITPAHHTYFNRRKTGKFGFQAHCRKCDKSKYKEKYPKIRDAAIKRAKKYYEQNKEKVQKRAKKFYRDNEQVIKVRQKEYREKNKKKLKEHYAEYRKNNKETIRKQNAEYYLNNKEKVVAANKKYVEQNKDRLSEYWAEYSRMPEVKERARKKAKERFRNDSKYRLNLLISNGIKDNLKRGKNGKSWLDLVDFTLEQLETRLKKTVPIGYSWEDFLNGELHIDHIIPKSKFNYEKAEDIDFKKAWSLSNLRLLPARENLSKGAKLEKPLQMSLIF